MYSNIFYNLLSVFMLSYFIINLFYLIAASSFVLGCKLRFRFFTTLTTLSTCKRRVIKDQSI